jgi:two-component system KDP operon response regulator KdpE
MRSTRPDGERGEERVMSERGRAASPPALAPVPTDTVPTDTVPTDTVPAHTPARRTRVLIVEDEPALLRALRIDLRARGYEVLTAASGRDALAQAARLPPDAVLLDLGLPDGDGTDVIRQLRGWSSAAVIVLSGRATAQDKIGALDAGADDYVTKPFSMEELLARLRAALRREDPDRPAAVITVGSCLIDLAAYTVIRQASDGGKPEPVHLTPTEWRLLEILLRSPGQLVGTGRLLAEVWGPGFEHNSHYLRFHMARLRRKLEDDPPRPRHLLTEPGMGYRYQP